MAATFNKPRDSRGFCAVKPEYALTLATTPTTPSEQIGPKREDVLESQTDVQNSIDLEKDSRGDDTNPPTIENSTKRKRGMNKARHMNKVQETIRLCPHVSRSDGTGNPCPFQETCKFSHDLQEYLDSKPPDIGDTCAVYQATGFCKSGWKCRWLKSHRGIAMDKDPKTEINTVSKDFMKDLRTKQVSLPLSKSFLQSLNDKMNVDETGGNEDNKTGNVDTVIKPGEKRKIDWSGAKLLAPLTTVGNIPFRRLCRDFGAEVTVSEMGVSMPLIQGNMNEWALPRAHASEREPSRSGRQGLFGVQISAPRPWQAAKATEILSSYCDSIDFIDLNCGCPIDLIYRIGAGSALLDAPGRLIKLLRGMTVVSGTTPITAKLRMGTKDNHPTASKLVARLVRDVQLSAITLHGRSRQQRYSRAADWNYISECASIVKNIKQEIENDLLEKGIEEEVGQRQRTAFIGNGDCYSYEDWYYAIDHCGYLATSQTNDRWIFEEIESRQHLDKTSSERLEMMKKFCNYGLEYWGSDEYGLNTTRRFICEAQSFLHRYVPVGILEILPPRLQDRVSRWCPRNEMEQLLASTNSADWVKISEMFLGPTPDGFTFIPKHKANASNDGQAEG
ncbi:tRNA-dihydrouridine(47) synthase [NAD(P)(+)] [Neolecta irregularis DAH-3]|uniref:tRNA-dihydrouridine(47) synthase [NAD(P)(+)] n=1 Tax=Neolecta irregularis (strain DAH-3) TaxID=1198029 RepID=A0A1U7LU91_NEOID|nr:tRNA-dihydrouridine(47) synthase [NAD(P)(+)] [Neolecta irregularis DAH-3]|eukprot:OLL26245.1 tRNA-dihydrouridine(47) synthase [NAD(P)(+)] [Neolecta irregularis DAH-3]